MQTSSMNRTNGERRSLPPSNTAPQGSPAQISFATSLPDLPRFLPVSYGVQFPELPWWRGAAPLWLKARGGAERKHRHGQGLAHLSGPDSRRVTGHLPPEPARMLTVVCAVAWVVVSVAGTGYRRSRAAG
jgi:hypothetical protein